MPITVQQFDFIAATQGINEALRVAEQAGGVTGTRDVATQVEVVGNGASGTQLSGQGGQYMPGTAVTDTSQAIGAAGSATSGDILGGGGSAADVFSPEGRNLQDIMNMYQGDTSANLLNAPVAAAATPPPTVSRDQQILDSVMAGTIIETSQLAEISDLAIREQAANQLAKLLVQGLGNTQASVQELGTIYSQFISGEGALNFNDWTTAAGLDWAQVPPPAETPAVNVDGGNVDDPMFLDDARAREVEGFSDNLPGTFGDSPGMAIGSAQRDQGSQDIFEFLGGFYALNQDDPNVWTVALEQAAQRWVDGGMTIGGQSFDNTRDAYNFLKDWVYSPTGGNIGSSEGVKDWTNYAAGKTTPSSAALPPTGNIEELEGGGLNLPMYAFGSPESQRTFGSIYPGFTSLLPGYNTSPAVSGALRSAQDPMNIQFLARQAMTPGTQFPGTEAEASAAASQWLQNINAGTQGLMQGSNYANFLNQLSNVLTGTPGAPVNVGGIPMDEGVRSKLAGTFGDPTSQMQAFMNPFYRSTAGSPEMRDALLGQIQQAAQRYQYQEPSGAFLPWAIEQNVGGIQSILPSLQGFGS